MRAFLDLSRRSRIVPLPVIPVLLPGSPKEPELPVFLQAYTRVDLREGVEEDGLGRLAWGITGHRPTETAEAAVWAPPIIGQTAGEPTGTQPAAAPAPSPPAWNVPAPTTFFTGREPILEELHRRLTDRGATLSAKGTPRAETPLGQALSGLGGIGKTQTALTYAQDFQQSYRFGFFVRAETPDDIRAGYLAIAKLLALPEKNAPNQEETIKIVHGWLEKSADWLLIFDNADDPEVVKPFLPTTGRGALLLTSRARHFTLLGIRRPVRMTTLPPDDALAFLLARTEREATTRDETAAAAMLAEKLGHLPLALEQAGAYVTEEDVSFRDYLESYRRRRLDLVEKTRPHEQDSVRTTWALNFDEVARQSAAAADLLRVLGFLAPEAIPYELLEEGAAELGSTLASELAGADQDQVRLMGVAQPLRRFSLVEPDPAQRTLGVHRMVQEVVRDVLGSSAERKWAERTVLALARVFPWPMFETWHRCERLAAHVRVAMKHIDNFSLRFPEATDLLDKAGLYAWRRGRYEDAELLHRRSLEIREELFGRRHLDVATGLNHLAIVHYSQGCHEDAEALFHRSLEIREQLLGPRHRDVAESLQDLAVVYRARGRFNDAEALFCRCLDIWEHELGSEHLATAQCLNNLGNLYRDQSRFDEAEPLLYRALESRKRQLDSEDPDVGQSLYNLASLYSAQGRSDEAEALYRRALAIGEQKLGRRHPDVAKPLLGLANLHRDRDEPESSRPLFERALAIYQDLGRHPELAMVLEDYAKLLRQTGDDGEAEAMEARARTMQEPIP